MNVYPATKIRNVCLLGHGGDGKTSLIESLLYMTKNTDRLGKVADGNTVSEAKSEECKKRQAGVHHGRVHTTHQKRNHMN